MTTNIEALYLALGDGDKATERAYDKARAAKVAEIAEYLAAQGFDDPGYWAEHAMKRAEEQGTIIGDEVSAEIAGHRTPSGRPLAFTV